MNSKPIYFGDSLQNDQLKKVEGQYVTIDNEDYYKISNYDTMYPFFMSIVSNSDHWMFISSTGSLTAGRKNPECALFPYYTDDKIHDTFDITGNKTIILADCGDRVVLWEPFSAKFQEVYSFTRNMYKSIYGNKVVFEEINNDLGLAFEYHWNNSEKYGFVKRSKITNLGTKVQSVRVLDGIQNILPYGVDMTMQQKMSNLVDAYKKNELVAEVGLGIYVLSSILTDKAEPSECLKSTVVWSAGLDSKKIVVSSLQLDAFRKGKDIQQETDIRAAKGAYFIATEIDLSKQKDKEWYIIAEVTQDASAVNALIRALHNNEISIAAIQSDIAAGTQLLKDIVGTADGLHVTENKLNTSRHFSNVLFNVMRGGIFDNGYNISSSDLIEFCKHANTEVFENNKIFFTSLPATIHYCDLLDKAAQANDASLQRICYEYLPLTFSRRHGDPSRPWNLFSINTKTETGEKILDYQGNWRDIFQNWEALCLSYPEFVESVILKFVNASTLDGYNPYRVTRNGIDWEVADPHDPWSNIGYWGDHQIIYLLKFLEISKNYHPATLQNFLTKEIFTYANVPYRIKGFQDLLKNPCDTIWFDDAVEQTVHQRISKVGFDGRLVWNKKDQIHHVNLTEKLLVSVLSKLSNFIPEGGIWLNTQRPEWNDANNALVGWGVSMVTLYYLRRNQQYCIDLFKTINASEISISTEVADMLTALKNTFEQSVNLLDKPISNADRRTIFNQLQSAGEIYRSKIYAGVSEAKTSVKVADLIDFYTLSLKFIDHSIKANKRADNLYHAYNLLQVESEKEISINYLYEMLEGQVALLSSGYLSPEETIEVLTALRKSKLYRADQHSYLLYPDRQLKRFTEKNNLTQNDIASSKLLNALVADGNKNIILKDVNGVYHFNGIIRNAAFLKEELAKLSSTYKDLVKQEQQLIVELFENHFDHKSFTGRSGTFYGYEGLGCIYWHMVSKLILAVEENYFWAIERGASASVVNTLKEFYLDVRAGLGFNKTPDVYGAFPTDPYSHTPGRRGAQQPGMTGQVKEDILSRMKELGVFVKNGTIVFDPILLDATEFLSAPTTFNYVDVHATSQSLAIEKDSLAFTFCQIPVVYKHKANFKGLRIYKSDKAVEEINSFEMNEQLSASIFKKQGEVICIEVAC